ncbi:Di-copper centre-containing protein [Venturia nashicola]|uniref:Di-copper centre-containing protein n=1 Tax=Venturia nashicola TaxID=86259 RepID=A0A4Z1P1V9_9PEZI|nr:Di-copper centre-containing protein [Venturia nashicola]TLD35460.1 Di-copper centre-containing protein [Venturia nashicola]
MFDGSDTSLSGNGHYIAELPLFDDAPVLPRGHGGGCIHSGPFANFSVNLGPIAAYWQDVPQNPDATSARLLRIPGGRSYNPRCIRRDISKRVSMFATSDANVTDLITNSIDYTSFQKALEATPSRAGYTGVHFGGHYTYGGDPGGDFYLSTGDPAFWFHHASVDRTWWTWQNLEPETRPWEVGLTWTRNNQPPSRSGSLDDALDMGVNGREYRVRDLVNTLSGPFCYIYE